MGGDEAEEHQVESVTGEDGATHEQHEIGDDSEIIELVGANHGAQGVTDADGAAICADGERGSDDGAE
eukprot:7462607-Pyramimonas_sp.AAC.1